MAVNVNNYKLANIPFQGLVTPSHCELGSVPARRKPELTSQTHPLLGGKHCLHQSAHLKRHD